MNLLLLTQQKGSYNNDACAPETVKADSRGTASSNNNNPSTVALSKVKHLDSTKGLSTRESRSCGLIQYFCDMRGASLTQVTITDVEISRDANNVAVLNSKSNAFNPIPLHTIDGVMKRSWDGGTNMKLGTDLQATLEGYGIYGDNASSAQRISNSKINTYHTLANHNNPSLKKYVPTTYTFPNQNKLTQLQRALDALCSEAEANKHLDRTQHPAIVLKYDEGTHGNELQFFKADEVEQLKAQLVESDKFTPFVLQAYIRPKAFNSAINNQAFSSHYRIIFSKAGLDNSSTYKCIGGIHFQRKGSWCSNSHNSKGELTVVV